MTNQQHTILFIFSFLCCKHCAAQEATKRFLDDMSYYWGDDEGYPDDYFQEIVECLEKYDEPMMEAQDANWRAFYQVYQMNGTSEDDPWCKPSNTFLESRLNRSDLFGGNSWDALDTYKIAEPCNYVSNVAYYNTALRSCRYREWNSNREIQSAVMKTLATNAFSSTFFHASFTSLSFQWDVQNGSVNGMTAYRILIQTVEGNSNFNSTIFRTLSNNLPVVDIITLTNQVSFLSLDESVPLSNWTAYLENIAVPSQERAAMGLVSFTCVATLPSWFCCLLLGEVLGPALLDKETLSFLTDDYLPTAKQVAENEGLPVPPWIGLPFFVRIFGGAVAYVWAVLFQENQIATPGLIMPIINATCLGALKTPLVDAVAGFLHGISNPNPNPYTGKEQYPGANFCNRNSPHALWHQTGADAVFELIALSDKGSQILKEHKKRMRKKGQGWFRFWDHGDNNSEEGWLGWLGNLSSYLPHFSEN